MQVKRLSFLAIILLSTHFICSAQNKDDFKLGYHFLKDPIQRGKFDFILGYNGLNNHFGEIGIARGYRGFEGWAYVYSSFNLSVEFRFVENNRFIIAPKLGYSTNLAFLNLGIFGVYYFDTQNNNKQFFIRPEIGPTFSGICTVFWGYNIGNEMLGVNSNVLGLRFIIGHGSLK
jgi:hypothetical protein